MNRTEQLGRYLQKEDTRFARAIKRISPAEGEAYRKGRTKRALDLAISVPASLPAVPIAAVAAIASAIDHKAIPFYVQKRRKGGQEGRDGGQFGLWKIRTMKPNSEELKKRHQMAIEQYGDKADPRITKTGRFLRKINADELLQVPQIALGQLSLFGHRAAPQDAIDAVHKYHPDQADQWEEWYAQGTPAVISLFSACAGHDGKKNERNKFPYDRIYAKRASLGLDLLIGFKTIEGPLSAIENGIRRAGGKLLSPFNRTRRAVFGVKQPVQDNSTSALHN